MSSSGWPERLIGWIGDTQAARDERTRSEHGRRPWPFESPKGHIGSRAAPSPPSLAPDDPCRTDRHRAKETGMITDDEDAMDPPSFTTTTHPGWLAEHMPDPTVPLWIWNGRVPKPFGSA